MGLKISFPEKLLASKNYRSFLRLYLEELNTHKKINYSDLSRRSGFSSRSFIKEVINGKKSLTAQSMRKIKVGLKLSGNWAAFFETLVDLEESEANTDTASQETLLKRLKKIREKILRQSLQTQFQLPKEARDKIFLHRYVPEIYASLGSMETGATLQEIKMRSGLAENQIQPVLNHFISLGIVIENNSRFFVKNPDVDIFGVGTDVNFLRTYTEALLNLKNHAEKNMKSDSELFLHSAVSIPMHRLPFLKDKLRKVVTEFINEEQNDLGEKIIKITLGLYT